MADAAEEEVVGAALVIDAVFAPTGADVIVLFPTDTGVDDVGAAAVEDASGFARFKVTPAAPQSLLAKSTVAITFVSNLKSCTYQECVIENLPSTSA